MYMRTFYVLGTLVGLQVQCTSIEPSLGRRLYNSLTSWMETPMSLYRGLFSSCGGQPSTMDVNKCCYMAFDWGCGQICADPHLDSYESPLKTICNRYNYSCHEYNVTTDDGYVLSVWRIHPPRKECYSQFSPIILQHGLLGSGIDWIVLGPNKSLGFILSDTCYDVWLPNSRGNKYSRHHKTISPGSTKFWDFSMDQMAFYDIPATISFIQSETQNDQVYFLGWSTGASIFYMFAELHPELAKKSVKLFLALAPIVNNTNAGSSFLSKLSTTRCLFKVLNIANNEVFLDNSKYHFWSLFFCLFHGTECRNAMLHIYGAGRDTIAVDSIGQYAPAGTSNKAFYHLLSVFNSGSLSRYQKLTPTSRSRRQCHDRRFRRMLGLSCCPLSSICRTTNSTDHVPASHEEDGGCTTCCLCHSDDDLAYRPWDIDVYTAVFSSDGDTVSSYKDNRKLVHLQQSSFHLHRVKHDEFKHADFMFSDHAHEHLYTYVVELLLELAYS